MVITVFNLLVSGLPLTFGAQLLPQAFKFDGVPYTLSPSSTQRFFIRLKSVFFVQTNKPFLCENY